MGGRSGLLNTLLATVEVSNEVIITDPMYAGVINCVHLAGGVPHFVPFRLNPGAEGKLDCDVLCKQVTEGKGTEKPQAMLLMGSSSQSSVYSLTCFLFSTWSWNGWSLIADCSFTLQVCPVWLNA